MPTQVDESLLDDEEALTAADARGLLRALAGAGAQVRRALTAMGGPRGEGLSRLVVDGRPRTLVLAGTGTGGEAARIVAAVAGSASPLPVVCVTGPVLPGWVGPLDLVVALSGSGTTTATLALADEAARRGARALSVARAGSPLLARSPHSGALGVAVADDGRLTRASLWGLVGPALLVGDALGVLAAAPATLSGVADRLDEVAAAAGPAALTYDNPAKTLALELSGTLPVVWTSGDLAAAAGHRFGGQLALSAKLPAVVASLPEVARAGAATLDGALGGSERPADPAEDFFRDRLADEGAPVRMRLVLVHDAQEAPGEAARRTALRRIAHRRVGVSELSVEGATVPQRLASLAGLVALTDFTAAYLALGSGTDPASTPAIDELEEDTRPVPAPGSPA